MSDHYSLPRGTRDIVKHTMLMLMEDLETPLGTSEPEGVKIATELERVVMKTLEAQMGIIR